MTLKCFGGVRPFMLEWCQHVLPVLSVVIGHILMSQGAVLWCITSKLDKCYLWVCAFKHSEWCQSVLPVLSGVFVACLMMRKKYIF